MKKRRGYASSGADRDTERERERERLFTTLSSSNVGQLLPWQPRCPASRRQWRSQWRSSEEPVLKRATAPALKGTGEARGPLAGHSPRPNSLRSRSTSPWQCRSHLRTADFLPRGHMWVMCDRITGVGAVSGAALLFTARPHSRARCNRIPKPPQGPGSQDATTTALERHWSCVTFPSCGPRGSSHCSRRVGTRESCNPRPRRSLDIPGCLIMLREFGPNNEPNPDDIILSMNAIQAPRGASPVTCLLLDAAARTGAHRISGA